MVHHAILLPAVAFSVLQTHLRRLGTRQFIYFYRVLTALRLKEIY